MRSESYERKLEMFRAGQYRCHIQQLMKDRQAASPNEPEMIAYIDQHGHWNWSEEDRAKGFDASYLPTSTVSALQRAVLDCS